MRCSYIVVGEAIGLFVEDADCEVVKDVIGLLVGNAVQLTMLWDS